MIALATLPWSITRFKQKTHRAYTLISHAVSARAALLGSANAATSFMFTTL